MTLTERTDIKLNNQRDCWNILFDGFILKCHTKRYYRIVSEELVYSENLICWYKTQINYFPINQTIVLEEKEPEWYEGIDFGKGILWWVWDSEDKSGLK